MMITKIFDREKRQRKKEQVPQVRPGWSIAMLTWQVLPASSIKPLQLIQNAAARYIFNEPKIMHVTPLFINLHWLPIAARIKLKALMFAYKITTGSAPL